MEVRKTIQIVTVLMVRVAARADQVKLQPIPREAQIDKNKEVTRVIAEVQNSVPVEGNVLRVQETSQLIVQLAELLETAKPKKIREEIKAINQIKMVTQKMKDRLWPGKEMLAKDKKTGEIK